MNKFHFSNYGYISIRINISVNHSVFLIYTLSVYENKNLLKHKKKEKEKRTVF